MTKSLVKLDNNLVWDGNRRPFYESYYLKINDSNAKWSLWLRYTFAVPVPGHAAGLASLWAVYMDEGGSKVALKQDYDMAVYDVVHADEFIRIGDSSLSLAGASGGIVTGKDTVKWELDFEDPVQSLRLYPNPLFYETPFPAAKFMTPRLSGFVTGTIFVNHKKITLKRERVHQGHVFGTTPARHWAWANCIDFREDSSAYFEALSGRLAVGRKKILRPCHLFCVGMDGKRFLANSIIKMLWQNRSHYDFDGWHCEFEKSGYRFECSVRRDPARTAGLLYAGPAEEIRHAYVTMMADAEIKVYKRRRGVWQDYKLLTSPSKCAFETVSPERHPGVAIVG